MLIATRLSFALLWAVLVTEGFVPQTRQEFKRAASRLQNSATSDTETERLRLLVEQHTDKSGPESLPAASAMLDLGRHLLMTCSSEETHEEAKENLQLALYIRENCLGPDHRLAREVKDTLQELK